MTGSPLLVRPLTANDEANWHRIMLEATRTHPAAFLLSHEEVAEMTPEQVAGSVGRGHLRGIFQRDTLLGFAGLHLWQLDRLRHRADIGPFYIVPEARGTGAADRLMQALVDIGLANGVQWFDLWVAVDNARAIAFYHRVGFKTVAQREDAIRLADGSTDDLLMTRRLGGPLERPARPV